MTDVGITLEIAAARLALYLTAEAKVLASQAYEIDGRKMTRADLREIREGLVFWQGRVDALGGTAPRPRGRARRASYRSR
ncbi:MAG: DUF6148 family protein [Rhizorhabdus sp.]